MQTGSCVFKNMKSICKENAKALADWILLLVES